MRKDALLLVLGPLFALAGLLMLPTHSPGGS
jgi:hypothetical protein